MRDVVLSFNGEILILFEADVSGPEHGSVLVQGQVQALDNSVVDFDLRQVFSSVRLTRERRSQVILHLGGGLIERV